MMRWPSGARNNNDACDVINWLIINQFLLNTLNKMILKCVLGFFLLCKHAHSVLYTNRQAQSSTKCRPAFKGRRIQFKGMQLNT
jgi:hypothetical protein